MSTAVLDHHSTLRLLVLNGPNLNLLGQREPHIYGRTSLAQIEQECRSYLEGRDVVLDFRQTNHEGQLVDWIQQAMGDFDVLILNAAAYTHTSIALHDVIKASGLPVIEIHLSNPHGREAFRHVSYISPVAKGIISGFGALSYRLAIDAALCFSEKGI